MRRAAATLAAARGLLTEVTSLVAESGLQNTDSVAVACEPSCYTARGIFPVQSLDLCLLYWQAASSSSCHQKSPEEYFKHSFSLRNIMLLPHGWRFNTQNFLLLYPPGSSLMELSRPGPHSLQTGWSQEGRVTWQRSQPGPFPAAPKTSLGQVPPVSLVVSPSLVGRQLRSSSLLESLSNTYQHERHIRLLFL